MAKGKDTAKLTDRQARDLLRKVTKVKPPCLEASDIPKTIFALNVTVQWTS